MRIVSVELENIKSYERARVEFSEGVNAIVGRNGAGKSTLLEAVGFALFDSLDYSLKEFVREGAKQGTVNVAFESSLDGRIYHTLRKIGGAGPKQQIYDPDFDAIIAEGGSDVERFLRAHLGMLPNADMARVFRDAVGVPQGTLTAAFLQTASARKSVFDALLQVDDFKIAFSRLLESRNLLLARENAVKQVIARLEGVLAALPGVEAEAQSVSLQLRSTVKLLAEARAELARLQDALHGLETQRVALLAAEKEKAAAQAAFVAGQTALQVGQVRLQGAIEARAVVSANQPGHDAYLEAQARKQQLAVRAQERQQVALERGKVESVLAMANHQAEQANEELDRIAEAETAIADLAAAAAEQARLEKRRALALAQQGEYHGAEAALKQAEQGLAHERKNLEALRTARAGLAAAEAALATTVASLRQLGEQKEVLDTLRSEKNAEGLAYKAQDENLGKVEGSTCPICEGPLTPEHRAQLMERNEARKVVLRDEVQKLRAESTALQTQIEEGERSRRAQEAALHKLPGADAVAEQAARVANLQAQRDASDKRCTELAATPAQLVEIDEELQRLGNPMQQIAIARATAEKRAATDLAYRRASAAAADAAAKLAALGAHMAAFADIDEKTAAVQRDEQEHFPAYQSVLANRQAAETVAARQQAVDSAATESTHLQGALARAETAAAEANSRFDAGAWTQTQSEFARLHGDVGSLSTSEQMLAQACVELERQINALRTDQKNLAEAQAELARIERESTVLEKLRNVINQAGPHVTAHLIRKVSQTAAQIYGELTGDFSNVLSWGEDYAITLSVNGRARGFHSLAGGEQMMAALAVRLALLRTITGISFGFFDEPTAHLDGPHREALASQILSYKGLRQLFVISHDGTFEHAMENTIRLERVHGASRVMEGEMA